MASRRRIGVATATIAVIAFATAISARPCVAQEQFITVHSGGLDGCLVSPKDEGLKRALRMLGDRIMELPEETGDHSMPAPVIRMARARDEFAPCELLDRNGKRSLVELVDPGKRDRVDARIGFEQQTPVFTVEKRS